MAPTKLYLNHDADYDWLIALEFGEVDDGQPEDLWRPVNDSFAYLLSAPEGPAVGFVIRGFSGFDAEAAEVAEIWEGPRFDAPALGLRDASAGEIALAAVPFLERQSTINRHYFDLATKARGVDAVYLWKACLQAGDQMAHFGLGYTLHELGRYREAYRHLRGYTELVPDNSWGWSWLGQACEGMGDPEEARSAYRRAIELERKGGMKTDAQALLARLDREDPESR